ncbi:Tat binding protein 1-interacting protein-domain-containing protein [Kockovaella imperatae]|uniref:Tat binding protein 1-interacting protein-domain-containing protein n=1 Tax=Kockovaella imperatae TaxID=4999 RepID=A0A1Y1UAU7_9TREE|nr:Tat binding protein 1-interacting protein-domain-containing protein [Kockovaella imperatae]ORX34637.1 Tat binding protein 1-interacting protein-domain-containing protein [Kockovaella imperatae]
MPPKAAAKEKAVKGDEAEELVLQYLKSTNRPYASADVSANLKGKVPKPAAQKILTTLAEKGSLTMKTYGKQTIFVYDQSHLTALSKEDLAALDIEIKQTSADLESTRKTLRSVQSDLSAQESQPKTKDLEGEIALVEADNASSLRVLLPLRGTGEGPKVEPMSAEEIKKVDALFLKWRKEWINRRKVYKELLGLLQDAGQVRDKMIFEDEQGISPDDEVAREVENGEFCQQGSARGPIRPTMTVKKVNTDTSVAKRSSSTPDPAEGKKKKVKKA